jgi:hypothetical protein
MFPSAKILSSGDQLLRRLKWSGEEQFFLTRFPIETGGARLGLASFGQTHLGSQGLVDGLPESTSPPGMIAVRNTTIWRKITWQITPGASVSMKIKDGARDFPSAIADFAAPLFRHWKQWFNDAPFSIALVCGVRFSGSHTRLSTLLSLE